MKLLLTIVIGYLLNIPMTDLSTGDLQIQVNNIPSSKGNLMIAIYNTEDGFREKESTYRNMIVAAQKGTMTVNLNQLAPNKYSVAVYHDSNGNGKLDKNFFGVPTEYYGFSNNARGSFGPPSFGDCSFSFSSSKTISIDLK